MVLIGHVVLRPFMFFAATTTINELMLDQVLAVIYIFVYIVNLVGSINTDYSDMDAVWFTVSFLAITAIATKIIAKRRATTSAPRSTIPAPPVVEGRSLVRFVHTLFTKGLRVTIHDEHARMGSVFTVSFLGLMKTTFLVGPDVLNHFYNGPESDINHGNMLDFMVPMFGKEVGYGVDFATRYEQIRFYSDPLKRPSKLRIHVDPIVQEVEVIKFKLRSSC